jgi:hypothetical protein
MALKNFDMFTFCNEPRITIDFPSALHFDASAGTTINQTTKRPELTESAEELFHSTKNIDGVRPMKIDSMVLNKTADELIPNEADGLVTLLEDSVYMHV